MEKKTKILFLPCAGSSGFGQLTNDAAFELMGRGAGDKSCIASLAAGVPAKMELARSALRIITLEGCPMKCAQKIVEGAGFPKPECILATDLKMRLGGPRPTKEETKKFADYVMERI
jgi:uncharacterized metal-binding protein